MQSKRLSPLALAVALAVPAALASAEEVLPNLEVNGFATVGGSWMSDDFGGRYLQDVRYPNSGVDEDGSLSHDTVLGLQFGYALSKQFDLVAQLVSAGREDFDTRLEWGYLSHQVNEKLRLRAGRFAAPLFMYSENLRVGQAYPWARPPADLYAQSAAFSSLDGIDLLYRQPIGTWTLDTQLTAGGGDVAKLNGKLKETGALNLTLSNGSLSLHAGYMSGKVDLAYDKDVNGIPPEQAAYLFDQFGVDIGLRDGDGSFADVGFIYDDGNWFIAGEYAEQKIEGMINDFQAGYFSVGHYFGKWLPYAVAGKINSNNSDECYAQLSPAIANGLGTVAFVNNEITTLNNGITASTLAITNATSAMVAANMAADAAFAANDLATYSTQLGIAAAQHALINQHTNSIALSNAGLQQLNAALTDLGTGVQAVTMATAVSCSGIEQTSFSLGFRYDATKNVSVKLEVDHVRDFNNTPGHFSNALPPSDESTEVITFNINAAF